MFTNDVGANRFSCLKVVEAATVRDARRRGLAVACSLNCKVLLVPEDRPDLFPDSQTGAISKGGQSVCNSSVRYPGGKNGAGVYQAIINQMPPHTAYYEPFLGGGAILRLKRPAAVNVGLDRDAAAVNRFLESSPDLAGGSLELTPSRLAMDDRRRVDPTSPGMASAAAPVYRIGVGNAFDFLRARRFEPSDLVYCDPPYLWSTRRDCSIYDFELSDSDHRRLLRLLLRLPCFVMVSGYWSKLYCSMLGAWRTFTFESMTRAGRVATEWVWCNFPEPVALHDYRYLGDSFRQRERIKRKTGRWVRRLGSMPLLERRALLDAIGQVAFVGGGEGRSTLDQLPVKAVQ